VNWFHLPLLDAEGHDLNAMFSAEEHRFGIHGGEIETSLMLALSADKVRMEHAAKLRIEVTRPRGFGSNILGNGKSAKLGWQMQDYNACGAVGNAAAATAGKGRAVLEAAGRSLARLLSEIDQLPQDTLTDCTAYRTETRSP